MQRKFRFLFFKNKSTFKSMMQDFDSAAEMKVIFKAIHNKHLFLEMTLLH